MNIQIALYTKNHDLLKEVAKLGDVKLFDYNKTASERQKLYRDSHVIVIDLDVVESHYDLELGFIASLPKVILTNTLPNRHFHFFKKQKNVGLYTHSELKRQIEYMTADFRNGV